MTSWVHVAGDDYTTDPAGGTTVVDHAIDGAKHTLAGATPGHFLKATDATTFAYAAHGLSYGDVGAPALVHTHDHEDVLVGAPCVLGRSAAGAGAVAELGVTGSGDVVLATSPVFVTGATVPLVIGSAAVGGTLTLQSTAHGTKGKILFGTGSYDEVNDRLGINTNAPVCALDLATDGLVPVSTLLGLSPCFVGHNSGGNSTFEILSSSSTLAGHRSFIQAIRSRGTVAAPTDTVDGDSIWSLAARGWANSGMRTLVQIDVVQQGASSGSYIPGRVNFLTSSASAIGVQALSIDSAQNVLIGPSTTTLNARLVVNNGTVAEPVADFQHNGVAVMTLDHEGDLFFTTAGSGLPYGSCWGNEIAWSQASAAQNTWYKVSDTDMTDGQVNLVTHDGSGKLTVTKAGIYKVDYSITLEGSVSNDHYMSGIAVNGTVGNDGQCHYELHIPSAQIALSGTAILSLAANGYIEIGVRTTDANTPTLTVDHLNVSLVQVGG